MLSKMHAKDAFWISLFLRFFSCTIIVISRKKGGDKKVKNGKNSLKSDRFWPHIPEIEEQEIKTNSKH